MCVVVVCTVQKDAFDLDVMLEGLSKYVRARVKVVVMCEGATSGAKSRDGQLKECDLVVFVRLVSGAVLPMNGPLELRKEPE